MSIQDGADGRIFISYRRAEAGGGLAGRLYDRLVAHFGKEQVFMDVDSIEPGLDFGDVIREAVGSCDVLLAMIGSEWVTVTDSNGRRRLDDSDDLVRLEIEAALVRKVRLIPVLINGATMPRQSDLPKSMAPVAGRNAVPLRHDSFAADVKHLVEVLDNVLTGHPAALAGSAALINTDQLPTTETANPIGGRDPEYAKSAVARNEAAGIFPPTTETGEPARANQRSADIDAGRSPDLHRSVAADLATSERGAASRRGIALTVLGVSLALVALGSWWLFGRGNPAADPAAAPAPAVASTVAAASSETARSAETRSTSAASTIAGASSADSGAAPSPVQIQAPANGESVSSPLAVLGTASVPAETSLWVVIKPPDGNFYLTTKAPVAVAASGEWTTQVGVGRGPRDAGIAFDIYAVLTPVTGSQFSAWVADKANGYGPFPTLPADTTPVANVRLTLR